MPVWSMVSRAAAEMAYTGPPSMPAAVMTRSPRAETSPHETTTFFTGAPSWRARNSGRHEMHSPQFAGRSVATATPTPSSNVAHPPSDPTRGQLAPPSARTTASTVTVLVVSPDVTRMVGRPVGDDPATPTRRWRGARRTPSASRRPSHARSRGVARNEEGKTRPLEPTNVGSPCDAHHARSCRGPHASSAGSRRARAGPYRPSNSSSGSEWVRFRPPRPASNSLRPTDGMWS